MRYFLSLFLGAACLNSAWSITELEELSLCAHKIVIPSKDGQCKIVIENQSKRAPEKGLCVRKYQKVAGDDVYTDIDIPADGTVNSLVQQEIGDQGSKLGFRDFRYCPSFALPNVTDIVIYGCTYIPYFDPTASFPNVKQIKIFDTRFYGLPQRFTQVSSSASRLGDQGNDASAPSVCLPMNALMNTLINAAEITYVHPLQAKDCDVPQKSWWARFSNLPNPDTSKEGEATKKGVSNLKDAALQDLWPSYHGHNRVRKLRLGFIDRGMRKSWTVYQIIKGTFYWQDENGILLDKLPPQGEASVPDFCGITVQWSRDLARGWPPFFEVTIPPRVITTTMRIRETPCAKNITERMMAILMLGKWTRWVKSGPDPVVPPSFSPSVLPEPQASQRLPLPASSPMSHGDSADHASPSVVPSSDLVHPILVGDLQPLLPPPLPSSCAQSSEAFQPSFSGLLPPPSSSFMPGESSDQPFVNVLGPSPASSTPSGVPPILVGHPASLLPPPFSISLPPPPFPPGSPDCTDDLPSS